MLVKAIAKATLDAIGHDEQEVKIVASRARLQQVRTSSRQEIASLIKQEFDPNVPLVVHFDGKLLPSIEGIFSILLIEIVPQYYFFLGRI
jgi:hypothetical protein